MPRTASAAAPVALEPAAAIALWTDVDRWPSFVEGFARLVERDRTWPHEGARIVWESGTGGRGRVTERVVEYGPERFVTTIEEERLSGTQRLSAVLDEAHGGTRADLELEYELSSGGLLRGLADVLFVRRAVRDALQRTLSRYAAEADEDADQADSLAD